MIILFYKVYYWKNGENGENGVIKKLTIRLHLQKSLHINMITCIF